VSTVMYIQVPLNVGKILSSYATPGFSRRAQLHGVSYMSYNSAHRDCIILRNIWVGHH
jgi:hypothetical protein